MEGKNGNVSRRAFLKGAMGAGAVVCAETVLAGCSRENSLETPVAATGPSPSWRDAPDPIDESLISSTIDVDLVVVGAGVGGITAALTGIEEGASVLLLEKEEGLAAGSHWIGAVNTKYYLDKGVSYDRAAIVNDLMWHASYRADQRLIQLWYDNSTEAVEWYLDRCTSDGSMSVMIELDQKDTGGAHMSPSIAHVPILGTPTEMGPNESGLHYSNRILLDLAIANGLDYRDHTQALQLVQDETGRVTGLIAENSEGYLLCNAAKGVILCTGGYIANEEMREDLNPAQNASSMAAAPVAPGCTGDGIKMATWVGAALSDVHWWMDSDRGILAGGNWRPGSQPWLKLDCFGNRFCNEDAPYDYGAYAGSLCPGHVWWNVFDDNYWEALESYGTTICSRMYPKSGAVNSELVMHSKDEFYAEYIAPNIERGIMIEAPSLDDLAKAMKEQDDRLDPNIFEQSLQRYNELCRKGVDEDFGKLPRRMKAVETGPFYAIQLTGSSICTLDGIRINESINAIDKSGYPIEGLYLAGNDQGGFYGMSYPWYYGGLNCGRTVTFARLAAKNALGA